MDRQLRMVVSQVDEVCGSKKTGLQQLESQRGMIGTKLVDRGTFYWSFSMDIKLRRLLSAAITSS